MSSMAATDSSAVLSKVGPKQTPKLDGVIKFFSCNLETLSGKQKLTFDLPWLDTYFCRCSINILSILKLSGGKLWTKKWTCSRRKMRFSCSVKKIQKWILWKHVFGTYWQQQWTKCATGMSSKAQPNCANSFWAHSLLSSFHNHPTQNSNLATNPLPCLLHNSQAKKTKYHSWQMTFFYVPRIVPLKNVLWRLLPQFCKCLCAPSL